MGRPLLSRELQRRFWRLIAAGVATETAAVAVGVSMQTGKRWFRECGGMTPMSLAERSGRCLSHAERDEITAGLAAGLSNAEIARRLGRHRSTIGREIRRNRPSGWPDHYRALFAQAAADKRVRRPKLSKLASCKRLHDYVQEQLSSDERWSPEQISRRIRDEFPDDEQMRISHEAIYRSLFVQGRGELRRELARCLRTGRTMRKPARRTRPEEHRGRISNMVMISERPAEVEDRAIPGHWEGDLIIGKNGLSAIGTLVERSTRFVMLLHLPGDRHPETVNKAIAQTILTLPEVLRRSLTWDQGSEMRRHTQLTIATGLDIYFCDPHSPWQRGSNENTNGLLRQYFPKGTDLSVHGPERLAQVAAGLNGRPRKTLHWKKPSEALAALLLAAQTTGVATTT
jgi:IS30 family transposase